MHIGNQLVPIRAPHTHPGLDTDDESGIRGCTDGVALRLLHSDPSIYCDFRPESIEADLIYEILEQFRVEALAPDSMPGIKSNLHYRFHQWSQAYIGEGLLENDVSLLIFTVIHVFRSRIMAEPIEERINDHTESTRAGLYQVLGTHLRSLRPLIHDQSAYAAVATQIAATVLELIQSAGGLSDTGRVIPSLLAMHKYERIDLKHSEHDEDRSVKSNSRNILAGFLETSYQPFTTEFDSTVDARDFVPKHSRTANRVLLDEIVSSHSAISSFITRSAHALFPTPLDLSWQSELDEGFIDPRLLTRLATSNTDSQPNIYRRPAPTIQPQAAVSLLIDCSGSMKGNIEQIAALIDMLARALDRVAVPVEILGFTTTEWNGGRVREEWLRSHRPSNPGRLNSTRHVVFKDFQTPWRKSRSAIGGLLWQPMFKEGVDGEAVLWAYERLIQISAPRGSHYLILISDGSPMDGATVLANGEDFLDEHLNDVITAIELAGLAQVFGLGIGHDMSTYVKNSHIADPERILTLEVARALVKYLAKAHHVGQNS
jgi:cobaltochelatase CobT